MSTSLKVVTSAFSPLQLKVFEFARAAEEWSDARATAEYMCGTGRISRAALKKLEESALDAHKDYIRIKGELASMAKADRLARPQVPAS